MEQNVITIENKMLRKIYVPIIDTERDKWRIKYDQELKRKLKCHELQTI